MVKAPQQSQQNPSLPPDPRGLFGHQQDLKVAQNLKQMGRLPPVILFSGRRGIGKKTFVSRLVSLLNCDQRTGCGECPPCQEWRAGVFSESLWLAPDGDKHVKETADRLSEHLAVQRGVGASVRVAVVAGAELMNTACANSLLKILEEPPEASAIFLTSDSPQLLLPTIRSRTVPWPLRPPSLEQSLEFLQGQFPAAGIASLRQWLCHFGNSPGLVREAIAAYGEDATLEQVTPGTSFMTSVLQEPEERQGFTQMVEELTQASQGQPQAHVWANLEIALNVSYRSAHKSGKQIKYSRLHVVRERLRRMKQLSSRGKITLNLRLGLEALGES